ncbi:CtsR family transcriptional regulator [Atopobacter phocae]|uniref:CtsR family transcriptional regulator n=1 Tax=Atopobacter phocae TaxID=136492 RepID=UPI000472FD33|nr:CtsR family transcriptional regulator [Atopobacter phocae]
MANLSDHIEDYIKAYLTQMNEVELRRSEIASQFDCVPSQINYVINTRFTVQKGYSVESKRGGSGYIRISKIQVQNDSEHLDLIQGQLLPEMTENDTKKYLTDLYQQDLMTKREAQLLSLVLNNHLISKQDVGNKWRSDMLKEISDHLKYLW